jgi:RNA:NAD 2'-phosphotransferase (TPT1/KptA family)
MSWLLRHGAQKEGVRMDEQGYVNVADMLQWQKMRKELDVTFEEVLQEVRDNEKQRFGLLYVPPEAQKQLEDGKHGAELNGEDIATGTATIYLTANNDDDPDQLQAEESATSTSPTAAATATSKALSHAFSIPPAELSPSHFLIRANQGHSIKTVAAASYLSPITLANPSSIPETVVHGTFYAAWDAILHTGGLKPMSRVHVHFATGPPLSSVLDAEREETVGGKSAEGALSEEKAVISGMRNDAQILIYINIRRGLEMGVPLWMSENGVVLSEGIEPGIPSDDAAGRAKAKKPPQMKVPLECWHVAVEVQEGLGLLWKDGKKVQDLPEHLKKMGWPHRKGKKADAGDGKVKGGGHSKVKGKDGAGKPRLVVERDEVG